MSEDKKHEPDWEKVGSILNELDDIDPEAELGKKTFHMLALERGYVKAPSTDDLQKSISKECGNRMSDCRYCQKILERVQRLHRANP